MLAKTLTRTALAAALLLLSACGGEGEEPAPYGAPEPEVTTEPDAAEPDDSMEDAGQPDPEPEPVTEVERKMIHEAFTGSNCGPCYESAEIIERVLADNPGLFTVMKYQIGSDPYISREAVRRRMFYLPGQDTYDIPFVHADGVNGFHPNKINNEEGYLQTNFDGFRSLPSNMALTVSKTVTDQTVEVEVNIDPLVDFPSDQLHLFIAIIENRTFHNVGSNGQTEFHYVFKKMLPNENGIPLGPLAAGQAMKVTRSHTFAGEHNPETGIRAQVNHNTEHTVEEFEDLSVVVFVQDIASLEVHQSEWDAPDAFPDVGSIEGRVFDRDGQPMADLPISCCDADQCLNGATGSDGSYRFESLSPDPRHLQVIGDEGNMDLVFSQEVGQWRDPVSVTLPARGEAATAWPASAGGTVTLAGGALELSAEAGALSYPVGTRQEEVSAVQVEARDLPPYTLLADGEPSWRAPGAAVAAFVLEPTGLKATEPVSISVSEVEVGLEVSEVSTIYDAFVVDPSTALAESIGTLVSDGEGTVTATQARATKLAAIILVKRP